MFSLGANRRENLRSDLFSDLGKAVHEANWAEISEVGNPFLLGEESDQRPVYLVKASAIYPQ